MGRTKCTCLRLRLTPVRKPRLLACMLSFFLRLSLRPSARSLRSSATHFLCRRHIATSTMAVQQPPWTLPVQKSPEPVLNLYNSLTRTKVRLLFHLPFQIPQHDTIQTEFVPINGRYVKWYNCGPTVYDSSHMGHARCAAHFHRMIDVFYICGVRNYVTQDVLRRIMTDYFGYEVHFVMNITDIDDKVCTPYLNPSSSCMPCIIWSSHVFHSLANETADDDPSKPIHLIFVLGWAQAQLLCS